MLLLSPGWLAQGIHFFLTDKGHAVSFHHFFREEGAVERVWSWSKAPFLERPHDLLDLHKEFICAQVILLA